MSEILKSNNLNRRLLEFMKDASMLTQRGELAAATATIKAALSTMRAARARRAETSDAPVQPNASSGSSEGEPRGFELRKFKIDGDSISYRLFSPSSAEGSRLPMVVMLHGCTQDALDFFLGTRMTEIGESLKFHVLFPQQTQRRNQQKCWNWFDPRHQQRGAGEPRLLAELTKGIARQLAVDEARVYIAGLSAGGAMAAIVGRAYPDVYAAVGVHSGLAPGCARDFSSAMQAMKAGGAGCQAVEPLPVIVFQGLNDHTVSSKNAAQVIEACIGTGDVTAEDSATQGRQVFKAVGRAGVIAEKWMVPRLGHAWFGGSARGTYATEAGPDASAEMARFFNTQKLPSSVAQ